MVKDEGDELWNLLLDRNVPTSAVVQTLSAFSNVNFSVEITGLSIPVQIGSPLPLLFAAVIRGSTVIVETLLERKAELEKTDTAQNTPLILAAALSNVMIVKTLCSAKANVNAHNFLGKTALIVATERIDTTSTPEVVETLLVYKADPFAQDARGRSAFDVSRQFSNRGWRVYAYTMFLRTLT